MNKDEEREEKSAWEKQLEVEKKERELLDGKPHRFQEIPERLGPVEALWYYNTMPERQDEIYHNFLSHLRTMEEWLEIYIESKDNMPSKELAFDKLSELDLTLDEIMELHQARYHDDRVSVLTSKRAGEYAGDSFEKWIEVHDRSPYGSKIRILATKNLRNLAKDLHQWQQLYDRSEMGSKNQTVALQNILLKSKFERSENSQKAEDEQVTDALLKGPEGWLEAYEKRDFHSKESAQAVVNIYISADLKSQQ